MALQVEKIKKNRMYQAVVSQIEAAIVDGELQPGDTLPPELKLKEMVGASRGTVREALRVLEEKGLIEVRPGASGGAVVRHTSVDTLADNLNLLLQLKKVRLDHMAEFRETVEAQATALAARRATPAAIEKLREIVARAKDVLKLDPENWGEFCLLDIELHVTLAEIAGNPVFLVVTRMIHQSILGDVDRFAIRGKKSLQDNLKDMDALVAAVASGDEKLAARLAREHIVTFNKHMKQRENT